MRSVPGYLARLTEAGRPGDTAALRPPRPLFAPSGGPPLAGTGGEARPPRLTPAAPARSRGGATLASRNDEPAAFDASRPRPARGPVSQLATGFRTGEAAGPSATEPVIFPGPAGRAGPPPRPAGADRQPPADKTSAAAALERPSPEPEKSAREEGASASQRPVRGPSASPAHGSSQGLSHGWPHDRASAPAARPDPIPELIPSPSPRSARDGNSLAAVSGQPAGPALHGAAPTRVTIGTIEVTLVPPAPPPPSPPTSPAPAWTPGPPRPSGEAVRRGARRWFGTGQI
jgi:hypothetical protein